MLPWPITVGLVICGIIWVIVYWAVIVPKQRKIVKIVKEALEKNEETIPGHRLQAWVDGKEVNIERMPPKSETYSNESFEFSEDDPDFSNKDF
jgi:hypothetical protein